MRINRENLAVSTPGGDAFAETPAEVRPLHGVLFVLACLAVAVCLLIFTVWAVILLTYTPGDPEQAGMGEIGVMLGEMAAAFLVLALWEMFRPVWLVGLVLSGALALRRRGKPQWLWVTSLCMVGAMAVMGAVMRVWL
jgi:hypothetical protein